MSVVIDSVAKAVFLSVRDLAEEPGFKRIGFDREGWSSFALGLEVHERVLTARLAANPAYRKEIHVSALVPLDDWTATLTGRIDGAHETPEGWHLEEFKTASLLGSASDPPAAHGGENEIGRAALSIRESPRRTTAASERHRHQLLLYAHLWTLLGHHVASTRLVYVDPDTGREERVPIAFDPAAAVQETETRLRRLLGLWQKNEVSRQRKAAFAEQLPFPHAVPRPGQALLIQALRDTVETGGHLLAEAPTGSGKTAASLHPALQHALRTGRQLAFLTSKNLQQQMAMKALAAMNPAQAFRTVQLRAKERMCANDRVLCHEDACPYARNYPLKMERSRLLDRLMDGAAHHLPDDVFAAAKAEQVCPFEVQLELARRADAIVADYNYVFDPGVALTQLRDEGLKQAVLVIDEAHNLPDRIRGIFSPELLESELASALVVAQGLGDEPTVGGDFRPRRRKQPKSGQLEFGQRLSAPSEKPPALAATLEQVLELIRANAEAVLPAEKDAIAELRGLPTPDLSQEGNLRSDKAPARRFDESSPGKGSGWVSASVSWPARLVNLWTRWEPQFLGYVAWKQHHKQPPGDDPIVDAHFALLRTVAVLRMISATGPSRDPGFAAIIERKSGSLRLAILCLDPSQPAAPIFRQASSALFLSATLRPFALFRRTLGLQPERIGELVVPSPFPLENRRVLILPQVRTTYASREKALPRIAELITEIDAAHGGNKLVLFPSYDFLRRVAETLVAAEMPKRTPDGGPNSDSLPRRILAQSPAATEAERHALLAALAKPPPGGHLLLAVLGGMFAEGVDYPGQLLEMVVVVSPGLPSVSFERELLRRHCDARDGNGFEQAYLQPGMTRVIQAAGRLIRTETDRGVIALVCQRFLEEGYVERLPRDWYRTSARELIATDPAADVRAFFATVP
jgi:DNA excision repair protein ERCC-2